MAGIESRKVDERFDRRIAERPHLLPRAAHANPDRVRLDRGGKIARARLHRHHVQRPLQRRGHDLDRHLREAGRPESDHRIGCADSDRRPDAVDRAVDRHRLGQCFRQSGEPARRTDHLDAGRLGGDASDREPFRRPPLDVGNHRHRPRGAGRLQRHRDGCGHDLRDLDAERRAHTAREHVEQPAAARTFAGQVDRRDDVAGLQAAHDAGCAAHAHAHGIGQVASHLQEIRHVLEAERHVDPALDDRLAGDLDPERHGESQRQQLETEVAHDQLAQHQ